MTEAQKIVEYALSQIGTAEDPLGSNKQKYGALIDSTDWYLYKDGDKTWRHKVNGYDWCTQFVDASFITTFLGIDKARKMLFRPVYNNLGAVVKYAFNYFRSAGRGYTKEEYDPKPGDVIYFQNSKGLSHTGIVVDVDNTTVTTVEGNSGTNGYYVAKHNYRKVNDYIYGYGHPDYKEEPEPTPKKNGWEKEDGKWYFYKDGEKITSGWVKWKGSWYYMGSDGVMMTGWQVVNGKRYYLYADGHMASSEWVDGYWLNCNGPQTYPHQGSWKENEKGRWWEDASGWFPFSRDQRIDGKVYNFNSRGYLI